MTDEMADSGSQAVNGVVVADELADTDGQEQAGEWFSPSVAAARLGISQRTLDRRIAAGKLRRRVRPNGNTQVWLPVADSASVADRSADRMADDGSQDQAERALALVERVNLAVTQQVQPLIELVERQQRTIADQAEELGTLKVELRLVREQLASSTRPTPPNANTSGWPAGMSPEPTPATKPWWRWLIG